MEIGKRGRVLRMEVERRVKKLLERKAGRKTERKKEAVD